MLILNFKIIIIIILKSIFLTLSRSRDEIIPKNSPTNSPDFAASPMHFGGSARNSPTGMHASIFLHTEQLMRMSTYILACSIVTSLDLGHKPDGRLGWSSECVKKWIGGCHSVSVACRPSDKQKRFDKFR